MTATQRDIAESRLIAPIMGHVGDGNFHLTMTFDMADADEVARAKALHERLVARALAMDGTCTGEHGVGQGKMAYLEAEHGKPALDAMRAIKRALDPDGIMNPGKIVNADSGAHSRDIDLPSTRMKQGKTLPVEGWSAAAGRLLRAVGRLHSPVARFVLILLTLGCFPGPL